MTFNVIWIFMFSLSFVEDIFMFECLRALLRLPIGLVDLCVVIDVWCSGTLGVCAFLDGSFSLYVVIDVWCFRTLGVCAFIGGPFGFFFFLYSPVILCFCTLGVCAFFVGSLGLCVVFDVWCSDALVFVPFLMVPSVYVLSLMFEVLHSWCSCLSWWFRWFVVFPCYAMLWHLWCLWLSWWFLWFVVFPCYTMLWHLWCSCLSWWFLLFMCCHWCLMFSHFGVCASLDGSVGLLRFCAILCFCTLCVCAFLDGSYELLQGFLVLNSFILDVAKMHGCK